MHDNTQTLFGHDVEVIPALPSDPHEAIKRRCLLIALLALAVFILCRNSGLYVYVLSDEYSYSKMSRLQPLAAAQQPNYLYLAIYRFTKIAGDSFLGCARVFNLVFFLASAPFIYLTARRFASRNLSLFVAVLALYAPINLYTAFFMPESLTMFGFWLFTWFILGQDKTSGLLAWCLGAAILGTSALIKPHALFLVPALAVFITFVSGKGSDRWLRTVTRNVLSFVAITFAVKLGLGFLLAGRAGLTLFGPVYSNVANSAVSASERYMHLAFVSSGIGLGHILAVCVMLGMPIAASAIVACGALRKEMSAGQRTALYALLVVGSLIVVASAFTASVVGFGPYETPTRLHMRYYDYMLPLLSVMAAFQMSVRPAVNTLKWRALAAFPIGIAIVYAMFTFLAPFLPNMTDCPQLRGFTANRQVFYLLSGMSLLSLMTWVYSPRSGAKLFLFVFMPCAMVVSSRYVSKDIRPRRVPDVFDKAALSATQCLTKEERSKLLLVGEGIGNLYRSLYYIDNAQAWFKEIPVDGSCDLSQIPNDREWILVIGKHPVIGDAEYRIEAPEFALLRKRSTAGIALGGASPGAMTQAEH